MVRNKNNFKPGHDRKRTLHQWRPLFTVLCFLVFAGFICAGDGSIAGKLEILIAALILFRISIIDLKTMIIPDELTMTMLLPVILSFFAEPGLGLADRISGAVSVSSLLFLMTIVVKDSFGMGDIKLIAVCGLMLGWRRTLLAGFIAVCIGGIVSIFLLISGKMERGGRLAFGPFLAVGILAALTAGEEIIRWYLKFY